MDDPKENLPCSTPEAASPHEAEAEKQVEVAPPKPSTAPLTPEEQMALYEEDLKENDWGHRPC